MPEELHKGLEDVLVAESGLSDIDGEAGRLVYRGYDIADLAAAASFEEIVYLLWEGELPTRDDLRAFSDTMATEREIDPSVLSTLETLAADDERPMAAVRTGVSMLSAADEAADGTEADTATVRGMGRRIVAEFPTILAAYDRLRRGHAPVDPREDLGHAANFLYMLRGEAPGDLAVETFDRALLLHADHGLNASTFTAMVIASTLANPYAAVTGAVGALSGPLHGGANQDVMELLVSIEESEQDPREWVAEARAAGERVPGWGHRVYRQKDPRAEILQATLEDLSAADGDTTWRDYTATIEAYLTDEAMLPQKGIAPNVDFYSGSVYHKLGIPIDLYTPIFAMARTAGWIGHVLEYIGDNRLIRPRARYTGPEPREFVPIDAR